MLFQDLQQSGFPETRIANEQHHLPDAVHRLGPTIFQQPDFLIAPDQRGQPTGLGHIETAVGTAFGTDPVDAILPIPLNRCLPRLSHSKSPRARR